MSFGFSYLLKTSKIVLSKSYFSPSITKINFSPRSASETPITKNRCGILESNLASICSGISFIPPLLTKLSILPRKINSFSEIISTKSLVMMVLSTTSGAVITKQLRSSCEMVTCGRAVKALSPIFFAAICDTASVIPKVS